MKIVIIYVYSKLSKAGTCIHIPLSMTYSAILIEAKQSNVEQDTCELMFDLDGVYNEEQQTKHYLKVQDY